MLFCFCIEPQFLGYKIKINHSKIAFFITILTVFFIGLSSRPGVTSIGSVTDWIKTDTGLSFGMIGLLTTIPVLCFGIFPYAVHKINLKVGYSKSFYLALIIVFSGFIIRIFPSTFTLFLGTLIMGLGITILNVNLGSYLKKYHPKNTGLLTSIYYSSLYIGPAIGAEFGLRLTQQTNSWSWGINIWIIFIPIAFLLSLLELPKNEELPVPEELEFHKGNSKLNLLKKPLTWSISFFFAIQCLLFFTITAWLPKILMEKGFIENTANRFFLLFNLIAIPIALLLGPFVYKSKNQLWATLSSPFIIGIGILLIILSSAHTLIIAIAVILIGAGESLSGSTGFALPILKSRNPETTLQVSAIAQTIGFTFAAIGPFTAGKIFDITNSWSVVLAILLLLTITQFVIGFSAGRKTYID